ncbi:MAG: hypothetical protein KDI38_03640 [Calditrichaeota bacterium]|nr:hypothetical protein [Calditrichota bacterium]
MLNIALALTKEATRAAWRWLNGKKRTLGGLLLFAAGAPFIGETTAQVLYWLGSGVLGMGAAHAAKKKKNGNS